MAESVRSVRTDAEWELERARTSLGLTLSRMGTGTNATLAAERQKVFQDLKTTLKKTEDGSNLAGKIRDAMRDRILALFEQRYPEWGERTRRILYDETDRFPWYLKDLSDQVEKVAVSVLREQRIPQAKHTMSQQWMRRLEAKWPHGAAEPERAVHAGLHRALDVKDIHHTFESSGREAHGRTSLRERLRRLVVRRRQMEREKQELERREAEAKNDRSEANRATERTAENQKKLENSRQLMCKVQDHVRQIMPFVLATFYYLETFRKGRGGSSELATEEEQRYLEEADAELRALRPLKSPDDAKKLGDIVSDGNKASPALVLLLSRYGRLWMEEDSQLLEEEVEDPAAADGGGEGEGGMFAAQLQHLEYMLTDSLQAANKEHESARKAAEKDRKATASRQGPGMVQTDLAAREQGSPQAIPTPSEAGGFGLSPRESFVDGAKSVSSVSQLDSATGVDEKPPAAREYRTGVDNFYDDEEEGMGEDESYPTDAIDDFEDNGPQRPLDPAALKWANDRIGRTMQPCLGSTFDLAERVAFYRFLCMHPREPPLPREKNQRVPYAGCLRPKDLLDDTIATLDRDSVDLWRPMYDVCVEHRLSSHERLAVITEDRWPIALLVPNGARLNGAALTLKKLDELVFHHRISRMIAVRPDDIDKLHGRLPQMQLVYHALFEAIGRSVGSSSDRPPHERSIPVENLRAKYPELYWLLSSEGIEIIPRRGTDVVTESEFVANMERDRETVAQYERQWNKEHREKVESSQGDAAAGGGSAAGTADDSGEATGVQEENGGEQGSEEEAEEKDADGVEEKKENGTSASLAPPPAESPRKIPPASPSSASGDEEDGAAATDDVGDLVGEPEEKSVDRVETVVKPRVQGDIPWTHRLLFCGPEGREEDGDEAPEPLGPCCERIPTTPGPEHELKLTRHFSLIFYTLRTLKEEEEDEVNLLEEPEAWKEDEDARLGWAWIPWANLFP